MSCPECPENEECRSCRRKRIALESYHRRKDTNDTRAKQRAYYHRTAGVTCPAGGRHIEDVQPDGSLKCRGCGRVRL